MTEEKPSNHDDYLAALDHEDEVVRTTILDMMDTRRAGTLEATRICQRVMDKKGAVR